MTTTRKPAPKKAAEILDEQLAAERQARAFAEADSRAPKPAATKRAAIKKAPAKKAAEVEAPAPAAKAIKAASTVSKEGTMTCRIDGEVLPVTKFPTKVNAQGEVVRDDRCRAHRDAATAERKAAKAAKV